MNTSWQGVMRTRLIAALFVALAQVASVGAAGNGDAPVVYSGRAAATALAGGVPESEVVAAMWQRYADAATPLGAGEGNGDDAAVRAPETFEWTLTFNGPQARVRIGNLRFSSAVAYGTPANRTVHAEVYMRQPLPAGARAPRAAPENGDELGGGEAKANGDDEKRPAVVLLHNLLDDQRAERMVARYLAGQGYVVVMVYLPHYGPRAADGRPDDDEMMAAWLGEDFASVAQAVWDVHRVRDWLHAMPFIDRERTTLMGVSLGGVVASLSAGIDPGFDRYVLAIAGGDIAGIIFHDSRETQALQQQAEAMGLCVDGLRERIRVIEPCTFAGRIEARRVLMFNMENDDVIPPASTNALIAAMNGTPTIYWYPGRHVQLADRFAEVLVRSHRFLSGDLPALQAVGGADAPEDSRDDSDERTGGEEE